LLHNVIEAYQWTHYEVTHQSITVTFGRDTILNETTAGDETWAFLQMHHPYSPPNAFFLSKSVAHVSDGHCGMGHPRWFYCHAVLKDGLECMVLHAFSAVPPHWCRYGEVSRTV